MAEPVMIASGAALTKAATSAPGCIRISVEAVRNHYKILAFVKAVAAEFVEHCNRLRCLTWRGKQEREAVNTAGLLRLSRDRPHNRTA